MMRTLLVNIVFQATSSIFYLALLRFIVTRAVEINDNVMVDYTFFNWDETETEIGQMLSNKKNCLPEQYRCGQYTQSSSSLSSEHPNVICECDDDCMAYSNCCSDIAARHWQHGMFPEQDKYGCAKLEPPMKMKKVVDMIGNCSVNFTGNTEFREFCSKKSLKSYVHYTKDIRAMHGYLLDMPVKSQKGDNTYVNFGCARCNDDADDLIPVQHLEIGCDGHLGALDALHSFESKLTYFAEFISEANYASVERTWTDQSGLTCQLRTINYQDQMDVTKFHERRPCRYRRRLEQYINQCDSKWKNEEDVKKCRMYSLEIFDKETAKLYKNPHCAKCNFVNTSSSQISCKRFSFLSKLLWRTSYAFIVPVNQSMQANCAYEYIWDPIQDSCHRIYDRTTSFIKNLLFRASMSFLTDTQPKFIVTIISQICLLLYIVLYLSLKSNRSFLKRNVMWLCFSLFILNFLILAYTITDEDNVMWLPVMLAFQYFWTMSLIRMNILSIDIVRKFSTHTGSLSVKENRKTILSHIYAWGVPILFIIVHIFSITHDGWVFYLIFFLIPVIILVILNIILSVIMLCKICQTPKETRSLHLKSTNMKLGKSLDSEDEVEEKQQRGIKTHMMPYLILCLLQSTTWVVWITSCFLNNEDLLNATHLINGLQGTCIFILFNLGTIVGCISTGCQKMCTCFRSDSISITDI